MAEAAGEQEVEYQNESKVLILDADNAGSSIRTAVFSRQGDDVHATAAALLNLPAGERIRCFHLPMFEKAMGWSVHMYIDLDAIAHKLDHNTNATQLWLIANLPNEPPEVQPDSIHGPVLLTAENFKDEEYVQLGEEEWAQLVAKCKEVQPNAQFLPMEPVATPPGQ
ncbi:hypothetical protein HYH02_004585 [Chlamydomonas schloesseri]|uniref:Uncharacterized protein n=1 Tax=Chlamydomonas schloesseri TaxID=2026947 RepID=A0A835WMX2_9CHLO|nr:hypothetical protein HYH02_004585 [Chlamydomonas schloesseri]|eukprot:KAG2450748.1 hypothetical protein HYH02_004585 [Chlamydomonas schloesseri]